MGLRYTGSFWDKAQQHMGLATNQYASIRPKQESTTEPPGKTAGGAVSAGAGMAMAGYSIGTAVGGGAASGSSAGPYGALIGAGVGLLTYLLS